MSNSKISALTSATTPLAGTEVLPIVQSGATVKVANNDLRPKQIQSNATSGVLQVAGPAAASTRVMTTPDANFTAARTDAAQSFTGDQTLSTGNLVQGTAAKGINFTANTPAAGMTSQLLNWYEEGTFTPSLSRSGGAPTITYTTRVGSYVRMGKLVFIKFNITWTGLSGSSGYYKVTGLPFTMTSGTMYDVISVIDIAGITFSAGYTQIACEARSSTTELYVLQAGSNVASATFTSGFAASGALIASGCYKID